MQFHTHTGCTLFYNIWMRYDERWCACTTQNACKLENARNSVRLVCVCNNIINIFKMVTLMYEKSAWLEYFNVKLMSIIWFM